LFDHGPILGGRLQRLHRGVGVDEFQAKALAGQVVLHALQYQRAAQALCVGPDVIRTEPQGAHDAGVERALCVPRAQVAAKGKTQVVVSSMAGGTWFGSGR
jgi:hypothetical protein